MSLFERHTLTDYVEGLRVFLGESRKTFVANHGLSQRSEEAMKRDPKKLGRLPRYNMDAVKKVEDLVNQKSARSEASDTTFGERFRLARDYKGLSDSDVAKHFGLSREIIRRWGIDDKPNPRNDEIAAFLDVPPQWLAQGGEQSLHASTHLGVRVGEEQEASRGMLYSLTTAALTEIPADAEDAYVRYFLEWKVHNDPEMAKHARRAGGRWQLLNGELYFAPWQPLALPQRTNRHWSEEVEAIVQEELQSKATTYAAFKALEERCKALGIPEGQYPSKIALYKRIEKERDHLTKFGVDINDLVSESVKMYS